jgi:hypothetical protein
VKGGEGHLKKVLSSVEKAELRPTTTDTSFPAWTQLPLS